MLVDTGSEFMYNTIPTIWAGSNMNEGEQQ